MPTFSFQALKSATVLSNYAFFHEGFVHTAGLTTTGGSIYLVNGYQGMMNYKEVANQLQYNSFTPFVNLGAAEVIAGIEFFGLYYYVYTNLAVYTFPISALGTALTTPNLPQITLTNLNIPVFNVLNTNTMAISANGTVYVASSLADGTSAKVSMLLGYCLPNGSISPLQAVNAPAPTLTDTTNTKLYADRLVPLNNGYVAGVRDVTTTVFSMFNVFMNIRTGMFQETSPSSIATLSNSVGQPIIRNSYTGPIGFSSRVLTGTNNTTIMNGRPNNNTLGLKGYRLDTGYKAVNSSCCNSYNNLYVFNIEDTASSTVLNLVASTSLTTP